MKNLIKVTTLGILLLGVTGCGYNYTQEDADKIENIIMGNGGSHVQTDETNSYLDANLDGFISPADYVEVTKQIKTQAEQESEVSE